MKKILILSIIILVFSAVCAEAEVVDYETILKTSINEHPQIKMLRQNYSVSEADATKDALLSNPTLDGVIRFKDGGRANDEFEVSVDLIQWILTPYRKNLKHSKLKELEFEVIQTMSEFVAKLKNSYIKAVLAQQVVREWDTYTRYLSEKSDVLKEQFSQGSISRLMLDRYQVHLSDVELTKKESEVDVKISKQELNYYMGRPNDDTSWRLSEDFPPMPQSDKSLEYYVSQALNNHWELKRIEQKMNQIKNETALADFNSWTDVEFGVSSEKDKGEDRATGPAFSWNVPIFDRGQTNRQKFDAIQKQLQIAQRIKQEEIRLDVTKAYLRLKLAREKIVELEKNVLPKQEDLLDLSLQSYQAMQQSLNDLFQDQQLTVDLKIKYWEAVKAYWEQRVQLELLSGFDPGSSLF